MYLQEHPPTYLFLKKCDDFNCMRRRHHHSRRSRHHRLGHDGHTWQAGRPRRRPCIVPRTRHEHHRPRVRHADRHQRPARRVARASDGVRFPVARLRRTRVDRVSAFRGAMCPHLMRKVRKGTKGMNPKFRVPQYHAASRTRLPAPLRSTSPLTLQPKIQTNRISIPQAPTYLDNAPAARIPHIVRREASMGRLALASRNYARPFFRRRAKSSSSQKRRNRLNAAHRPHSNRARRLNADLCP